MRAFVFALATLAFLQAASAHMCAVYPPQRGGVPANLTEVANAFCGYESGPCGGVPAGPALAYIQSGSTWQFTLQKNLDHFNGDVTAPSLFEINLSADGKTFMPALAFADDSAPSGSLYTVSYSSQAPLPKGNLVVQFVYKTNNPKAPAAFYQCADVQSF